MGILDDFIKAVKGQREQYKAEQKAAEKQAGEERAAKERERVAAQKAEAEKKAREGKPAEHGYVGEAAIGGTAERIKEQRKQFEEAQKRGEEEKKHPVAPSEKRGPIQEFEHRIKEQRREFEEAQKKGGATVQEQKVRELVELFGHKFKHVPGMSPHVWIDDPGKAVYIDDPGAYLKSGGKVEVKGVTSAMEPYVYDIYTNKGGPLGQARYYRQDNVVVSLVPDPFTSH